jgi:hypothetical protein
MAEIERRTEAFRAAASEALELAERSGAARGGPGVGGEEEGPGLRLPAEAGTDGALHPPGQGRDRALRAGRAGAEGQRALRGAAAPAGHRPQMSIVLWSLQDQGKIHQVRRGRPHWELRQEGAGLTPG